jgi:hypothetical protein
VEKMADGSYGARHPIADYEKDEVAFNYCVSEIDPSGKFDIILAGTTETEIEIIPIETAFSQYEKELSATVIKFRRFFNLDETLVFSKDTYNGILSIISQKSLELWQNDIEFERTSSVDYQRLSDKFYQKTLHRISKVVNRKKDEEDVFNSEESNVLKVFRLVAEKTRINVKESEKITPQTRRAFRRLPKTILSA